MVAEIWIKIASDYGLLPHNSRPLSEPILTIYMLNCSKGLKVYSYILCHSFTKVHIDMAQVVEISSLVNEELTYST